MLKVGSVDAYKHFSNRKFPSKKGKKEKQTADSNRGPIRLRKIRLVQTGVATISRVNVVDLNFPSEIHNASHGRPTATQYLSCDL